MDNIIMADMTNIHLPKEEYFHRSHPLRRESIKLQIHIVTTFASTAEGLLVLYLQTILVTQELAARFSLPRAG